MKFSPELQKGVLLRRYKRFLTDVMIGEEQHTAHCPNTGSMLNCVVEGSPCWLSESDNPKRKYPLTWELATTPTGHLACINTHRANELVAEALTGGLVPELRGYTWRREVKYGEGSRVDFLLERQGELCYLEVKSVTLGYDGGRGLFPDAKSDRATKHLKELISVREQGHRAVLFFCVQHTGIEQVAAAHEIDPVYAKMLSAAHQQGVEVMAYRADISPRECVLTRSIPVEC